MSEEATSLRHFGVKGMQWGKRKAKSSNPATIPVVRSEKQQEKYENSVRKTVAKKGVQRSNVANLSDQELERKIKRMNMEKQYKELTTVDYKPTTKFLGDMFAKIFTDVATEAATAGVKGAFHYAYENKKPTKTLAGIGASTLMKQIGR